MFPALGGALTLRTLNQARDLTFVTMNCFDSHDHRGHGPNVSPRRTGVPGQVRRAGLGQVSSGIKQRSSDERSGGQPLQRKATCTRVRSIREYLEIWENQCEARVVDVAVWP